MLTEDDWIKAMLLCIRVSNFVLIKEILPHINNRELISPTDLNAALLSFNNYIGKYNIIKPDNSEMLKLLLDEKIITLSMNDILFKKSNISIIFICNMLIWEPDYVNSHILDNILSTIKNNDRLFRNYVDLVIKVINSQPDNPILIQFFGEKIFQHMIHHVHNKGVIDETMNKMIQIGLNLDKINLLDVAGDFNTDTPGNVKMLKWLIANNDNLNKTYGVDDIDLSDRFLINMKNERWARNNINFSNLFLATCVMSPFLFSRKTNTLDKYHLLNNTNNTNSQIKGTRPNKGSHQDNSIYNRHHYANRYNPNSPHYNGRSSRSGSSGRR